MAKKLPPRPNTDDCDPPDGELPLFDNGDTGFVIEDYYGNDTWPLQFDAMAFSDYYADPRFKLTPTGVKKHLDFCLMLKRRRLPVDHPKAQPLIDNHDLVLSKYKARKKRSKKKRKAKKVNSPQLLGKTAKPENVLREMPSRMLLD